MTNIYKRIITIKQVRVWRNLNNTSCIHYTSNLNPVKTKFIGRLVLYYAYTRDPRGSLTWKQEMFSVAAYILHVTESWAPT